MLQGVEGRGAKFGRGSQVYLIVGHLPLRIAYRSQRDLLENVIAQVEPLSGAPLERDNIAERIVSSHLRAIQQVMCINGERPGAFGVGVSDAPESKDAGPVAVADVEPRIGVIWS